jgi:hypothetical protein
VEPAQEIHQNARLAFSAAKIPFWARKCANHWLPPSPLSGREQRLEKPQVPPALAYYTIFSLAPLLIISIPIAGFVFGSLWRTTPLGGRMPPDSEDA